jgi:hypothetical protein
MNITRCSPPGEFDQCPQGTECIVTEGLKTTIYIQQSADEDKPIWREKTNSSD